MPQALAGTTSKGVTLSFGAINLTVSVHSAVADDSARKLKSICMGGHEGGEAHAPSTIRQRRYCPVCDNDAAGTFLKGQQVGDGFVVIPQNIIDLEKAAALEHKSMTVSMHPIDEVVSSMLPSGKSYYLSLPNNNPGQRQAYTLLSRLIRERGDLAFMTRFTLRTAVSVFQVRVAGPGTLVLQQMADAELVREHPAVDLVELGEDTMKLGNMLADMEVKPFVPGEHGTGKSNIIVEYAAQQSPIAASAADAAPVAAGGPVADITELLAAALAGGQAEVPAPRKRATAKKATAKKAAARTTVRKAS